MLVTKEHQKDPTAVKIQSDHKPDNSSYDDDSSTTMDDDSFTHISKRNMFSKKSSSRKMLLKKQSSSRRMLLKMECQKDPDTQKRRSTMGGHSGNDDNKILSSRLKTQSDHKPKNGSYNCGSSTMDDSLSHSSQRSLFGRSSSRKLLFKKEYQKDPNAQKRRSTMGGHSGNDDNNDSFNNSFGHDECASNTHPHQSSFSSVGSRLSQSFRSLLKPDSLVSRRERKPHDSDNYESFSYDPDGPQHDYDDECGGHGNIDEDKLMVLLCKELELTFEDDNE